MNKFLVLVSVTIAVKGLEWATIREQLATVQNAIGKEDLTLTKFAVRRMWKTIQSVDPTRSIAVGLESSGAGWEVRGRLDQGSIGGSQVVGVHGGTRVYAKGINGPVVIGNLSQPIIDLMSGIYGSCRTDAPPAGYRWVSSADCGLNHFKLVPWKERECLKAPIVKITAWTDQEEALLHFEKIGSEAALERDRELAACAPPPIVPPGEGTESWVEKMWKKMPKVMQEIPQFEEGFRYMGEL